MVFESKIDTVSEEKREVVRGYIAAFRPDYWFKNVFTLMGMVGAVVFFGLELHAHLVPRLALALLLSCFTSSVAYVINEVLDASFDALHPVKKNRPIPSGKVDVEILLLLNTGLLLLTMSASVLFFRPAFSILLMIYLVSAALYNMPPIRLKDRPFLDILNESSSSPIRFLIGWFSFGQAIEGGVQGLDFPPAIAILLLWLFGAYIMTGKRLAEARHLAENAARYRKSFGYYTVTILSRVFVFCGVLTIVFFLILCLMHKPTVLYATPLIVVCFVWFSILTSQEDSIIQQPETIVRKPLFVCACLTTFGVILYLML